jgi:hypothetical protein
MANFLIDNFIWLGLALVALLVGIKLVAGAILHRLMQQSAADEASRKNAPPDPGGD